MVHANKVHIKKNTGFAISISMFTFGCRMVSYHFHSAYKSYTKEKKITYLKFIPVNQNQIMSDKSQII